MSTYMIIGGDGKEYGPVTVEQVKQWLAEGRANGDTPIKVEGTEEWKKVSDFSEFSGAAPLPTNPILPSGDADSIPDYNLEVGKCLQRGWELFKQNWKPTILAVVILIGFGFALQIPSAIGKVIQSVAEKAGEGGAALFAVAGLLNVVSGILCIVFQGAIIGGFYYFFLKIIRGEASPMKEVLAQCKQNFVQLMLAGIVTTLLITLGCFLCFIPGIYLGVSYAFVFPLVIDKKMGFWDAMELSRKTVTKKWFLVLLLLLLTVAIYIIGILLCFVGILVSTPIAVATLMYAYEDIFSQK